MKKLHHLRLLTMVASGAMLLQAAGCTFADFNALLQAALLGVTAAGSVAILQNI